MQNCGAEPKPPSYAGSKMDQLGRQLAGGIAGVQSLARLNAKARAKTRPTTVDDIDASVPIIMNMP